MKKILVIGASPNPSRYAFKATRMLQDYDYEVYALGRSEGKIGNVNIDTANKHYEDIDTISLYLNAKNAEKMQDYILSLSPNRLIINPGSENPHLEAAAIKKGIQVIHGCTLVMLSTGTFNSVVDESGVLI